MLKVGQKAPNFSLPDQTGKKHKLTDYRGNWLLIYFYPKDDTVGCTKEACSIRDNYYDLGKIKAAVVGVSIDSVKSHDKFATKYDLPFPLLSDENKIMVDNYGAWGEKSFMGRTFLGIKRISYLIDPTGKVAKVYEKVKPAEHAAQVLTDLRDLQ